MCYQQSMIFPLCADGLYVTWGATEGAAMSPGQSLPPHGKQLGRLDSADLKQVIQKVLSEGLLYHYCILKYTVVEPYFLM